MGRKILQLLNGLITFAVTVCLIGAGAYAGFSLWDNQQVYDSADSVYAELKDIRATIQTPTLSAMEQLLEENRQKREAEAAERAAAEAAAKEAETAQTNTAEATPEAAQAVHASGAEATPEATQAVQAAATDVTPVPATETGSKETESTQTNMAEATPEGTQAVHAAGSETTAAPATAVVTAATVETTNGNAAEQTPEPTTELTQELTQETTTEQASEPVAEETAESMTEATSEPTPETTVQAAAETTVEATFEPTPETTVQAAAETTAEATLVPTAEATAEPTAEQNAEQRVEATTEPAAEPTAEPTAEASVETTTEPTAAFTTEPTPAPTAEPTPVPTAEPTAEPTPEPMVEPTPEPTPDNSPFGQLKQINKDITAWLTMPGTAIDYPVLQGESNYSYINTDVYGNFALAGSIFLDSRNDSEYRDTYSLLYGHNMSQHRMFSDINLYKDKVFFDENKLGLMLLPDGYHILESLCVIVTRASDSGLFNPDNWKSLDAEGIRRTVTENAMYLSEEGMQALEDQLARMTDGTGEMPRIVSLSTCSDEFTDARTILLTLMDP